MTSTPDDAATDQTGAGPDPDTAAVLRDLATSIALLPQVPPSEGEERPEGAIALPVIEQDGQRYIPVFTSEDALRSAGADVDSALRIPLAQLAANWPSDDMWLAVNPASEDGLGLPPDVVRALPVFAGSPDGAGESSPG
ncbi:SseB family protein [Pseudonocardia sp. T1-2H]|uniref:SseB family protein n=1 Tax=Pseudonocardia sp. T1-2H TaxID=3128899 RepID=UPI0031016B80